MNPEFLPFDLPVCDARQHALVHASVLTMADERVLADHTVVVEAGRIRTIGPSYDIDTAGMQVFDCRSRFVMPGLADMYTHYWDPADSPLYLAAGVTTVRTVCVPFQLALSKLAERGEFPSPRMVTLSPPIDGVNAQGRTDMPRGVAMTDASQAQALIRRFVASGYDQIKGFSLLAPDNLRALCSAARDAGIRVTTNCPNAMRFEDAIEAGVHCLDQLHNVARGHLRAGAPEPPFWDRFDPVPGTRLDFDAIQRLGGLLAERDVWNVPTLVFHQRDGLPPAEGMRDPDLRYVSAQSIEDWDATLGRWTKRAAMTDADAWRAAARERARAFIEVVRMFASEGAPLLTGTDSLNPWNVPGRSLHTELANFVTAGMRTFEALQCATTAAARFLGESGESGETPALRCCALVRSACRRSRSNVVSARSTASAARSGWPPGRRTVDGRERRGSAKRPFWWE